MPYTTTEPFNLAEIGLVEDTPSNSTAPNAWSDVLNMRAKDNSVQGVLAFGNSFAINDSYNGATVDAKPRALTQWTPAGSSHLNIAYTIASQKAGEVNKGRTFVHNTNTETTAEITNATADDAFQVDPTYPPQLFVFDELLVMNPGTGNPQQITADATTNGNLDDLPGWSAAFPNRFARVMKPFGNRLLAMNFHDDNNTSTTNDDNDYPVLFAWSNPVALIGSLSDDTSTNPDTSGAQWQKTTTNTAGFNFLVSTPGGILDGEQLGEEFMAYKSDAVVRVIPIDEGNDFAFEAMFEDDGIFSTRCVTNIGNSQHFVMGNYGLYTHNGRGDKQVIGKGVFQDALYADIKPADKDRTFLFHQTRDKEVWICYSSLTNSGEGCDMAYVYDYESSKVHKRTLPGITDLYETEIGGELKIFATQPSTKQVQELNTKALVTGGYILLENKPLGGQETSRDIIEMHVGSEKSIRIALDGNGVIDVSKVYIDQTFNPSEDYKLDVRENGKFFSFRFTMDGVTNPKLTTIAVRIRDVGRR